MWVRFPPINNALNTNMKSFIVHLQESSVQSEVQRMSKLLQSVPKQLPAQYSTKEQLEVLKWLANRFGLYDAADQL